MMRQERDSFVFISSSEISWARIKQAAEYLSFETHFFANLNFFLDSDRVRPRTLLLDMRDQTSLNSDSLSKLKKLLPKTQVVGLVEKPEDVSNEWFLQHYMTADMVSSFALEFFLFHRIFCEFYPISPSDLFPDTEVYFNAYHFLPLNQKYLPLVHEDFLLSEKKHKRIEKLKSLYIYKEDTALYVQYIEKYFDQFNVGLKKRAKARIYHINVEWRELLYSYLFERREIESNFVVRPDFTIWLDELMSYFSSSKDPWSLIYELMRLPCFDYDRSLMEAVVACFLSRNLGDDEAEKILDLRLILALTRTLVDPLLHRQWLLNQPLSLEDLSHWNSFPESSKSFKFSPQFPVEVIENLQLYHQQFLTRSDKEITKSQLVYTYLSEVIASIMRQAPSDDYKKDEIIENTIVKCKADGIISEAWLEEIRQFLKK
jgi:hypothetical protein